MIYIIEQEGSYQNKVNSSLVCTCNCKMGYYDPILVTFGQICNFRKPNLVTFYFYELTHFFRLNEEHFTFHLQYKHSGTFANHKYQELS